MKALVIPSYAHGRYTHGRRVAAVWIMVVALGTLVSSPSAFAAVEDIKWQLAVNQPMAAYYPNELSVDYQKRLEFNGTMENPTDLNGSVTLFFGYTDPTGPVRRRRALYRTRDHRHTRVHHALGDEHRNDSLLPRSSQSAHAQRRSGADRGGGDVYTRVPRARTFHGARGRIGAGNVGLRVASSSLRRFRACTFNRTTACPDSQRGAREDRWRE